MWVWSQVWEEPLEEGMATHSSILAWRIPWTEMPGRLWLVGSQRVGHDWSGLARMHSYSSQWPTRPCRGRLCQPSSPVSCCVSLKTTCSSCILSFGFWNTTNFVIPLDVLWDTLFSLFECMFFHCLGVTGSSSCRFQLKTSWSSNILLWPYLCKQVFHDLSFSVSASCLHLSLTLQSVLIVCFWSDYMCLILLPNWAVDCVRAGSWQWERSWLYCLVPRADP